MIDLLLPYNIPSQNVRDRWHWSKRARDQKMAERWIRYVRRPGALDTHNGMKRQVVITSYRKRRITDDANLRGGAKSLADALVNCGLLKDDSDQWMVAEYHQEAASKSPTKKPATRVVITDLPQSAS